MKMIKKVLAAVLAMAMVIGMMAMSTFAADNTYNVAGAEGLTGVNWDPSKNEMTKGADGIWTKQFDNVKAGSYEFKIATNGAWDNGEYNLEGDASSGGKNAKVEVAKDGSTVIVSFDGTKASVKVTDGDTPTGDSSAMVYVVAAVVALAGAVTVVCKRRSVEA